MNFNSSRGFAVRTVIILGVTLLVVGAVVYGLTRYAVNKRATSSSINTVEIPQPVYEGTIGDTKFALASSINNGKVLIGKASRFPSYQANLTTTERFITVTVTAQNKGKIDSTAYAWQLGNIVDSDGRNFVPITEKAYSWLPFPDLCGAVLHPEFQATPCIRIYEVSKISTGLKIQVMALKTNSSKMQTSLLDLNVH